MPALHGRESHAAGCQSETPETPDHAYRGNVRESQANAKRTSGLGRMSGLLAGADLDLQARELVAQHVEGTKELVQRAHDLDPAASKGTPARRRGWQASDGAGRQRRTATHSSGERQTG
eukprot:2630804-Rhodomonas_salina.11